MFGIIVEVLEKVGLAILGTFFQTTAVQVQNAGIDSSALDYLNQLVASAQANTTLATGAEKYDFVYSQAASYFKSRGIDLAISLMESLIGLAVHNLHASTGVVGALVSSIGK